MPRLPRDIDGLELVSALKQFGYTVVRQHGSHIRFLCTKDGLDHHVTIPAHSPLKVGTLSSILDDVSSFLSMEKGVLIQRLF
jgi:predicted RNA binding protein YcfA (HicA-like mRNA interferase family)